ncbi:Protein-L-isoaspartate O-methyltransferase [Streptomyces sp. enrichment culture]|uniref:ATP-grasp peptide maturase system methyltransferase n=1 Tax=Streptomyces sp. enrichment culture TaxID=1795815 RepID=UPI003F557ACF
MNADSTRLRAALAASVPVEDPAWRAALAAVPRELFLGDAVFRSSGGRWEPLRRRTAGDDEWLRLVYADKTWVTQVDGIAAGDASGSLAGRPTSSSTLPSLVVRMLDLAGVREGDRVLEVGTGTGYSTALLCHRLGDGNVYSVEYDARLATAAADRLHRAGCSPTLLVGDGLAGHEEAAEYDAVVATCAVRYVPPAWLRQVRAGGGITVCLSGWMVASGLVRLTVHDDGTASGRFAGDRIGYMLARPHERPPRPAAFHQRPGQVRPTRLDPGLVDDWTGAFVAQLAAPSAELMTTGDGVVLVDVATGSQAWTSTDGEGWVVHQHGPLRLWDAVEDGLRAWRAAGAPPQSEFGMVVRQDGTQRVWAGGPDGVGWELPA